MSGALTSPLQSVCWDRSRRARLQSSLQFVDTRRFVCRVFFSCWYYRYSLRWGWCWLRCSYFLWKFVDKCEEHLYEIYKLLCFVLYHYFDFMIGFIAAIFYLRYPSLTSRRGVVVL